MEEFFRELAADAPRWNFIWMYEDRQQGKILSGLWMTVKLSLMCLLFSVIIGLVGAWMQGSPSRIIRAIVQGYIQFFRNTPPLVQLLFFYFALGQFTPVVTGEDGWPVEPIISNVGWAVISLSFFAGAFNVVRPDAVQRVLLEPARVGRDAVGRGSAVHPDRHRVAPVRSDHARRLGTAARRAGRRDRHRDAGGQGTA